ncbi:hypothetical protein M8C21_020393, partial [Ambrosia artemisiifolia]
VCSTLILTQTQNTMQQVSSNNPNPMNSNNNPAPFSLRASHRRAHFEVNYRLPDDLDLVSDTFDTSSRSFEEIGSEDDLLCYDSIRMMMKALRILVATKTSVACVVLTDSTKEESIGR